MTVGVGQMIDANDLLHGLNADGSARVLIDRDLADHSCGGDTAEHTLYDDTMSYYYQRIDQGSGLRMTCFGACTGLGTGHTLTTRFKSGSSVAASLSTAFPSNGGTYNIYITVELWGTLTSAQRGLLWLRASVNDGSAVAQGMQYFTTNLDMSGVVNLKLTGQWDNSTPAFTEHVGYIERFGYDVGISH